jgi:ABC-type phosphate/phosphonate transport system substrate-binding protein
MEQETGTAFYRPVQSEKVLNFKFSRQLFFYSHEVFMAGIVTSRSFRAVIAFGLLAFGSLLHAQGVFRVTAIPDESPTELARKAAPLMKYLEKTLGMKVEFRPVTDYAASVEALANKQRQRH